MCDLQQKQILHTGYYPIETALVYRLMCCFKVAITFQCTYSVFLENIEKQTSAYN